MAAGFQEWQEVPDMPGGLRGRWSQKWQGAPGKGVPRFAGVPGVASGPKNGKGSQQDWQVLGSRESRKAQVFFPIVFLL